MMAPAWRHGPIWAQSRGSSSGRVTEAPRLGSPDLGAAGVGEGRGNSETAIAYEATSRRYTAVEVAQQLLGDGQSKANGVWGKDKEGG